MGGVFERDGKKATTASLHFRIDAYPLYSMGGTWRDVGVLVTAGVGSAFIERDDDTVAEGLAGSAIGLGAFYEPIHFWMLRMGPQLEYAHQYSQSISAHSLIVGWRTAFYAGP